MLRLNPGRFSDLATIKRKACNRLDVESDIRLDVSKMEPNPKRLAKTK